MYFFFVWLPIALLYLAIKLIIKLIEYIAGHGDRVRRRKRRARYAGKRIGIDCPYGSYSV